MNKLWYILSCSIVLNCVVQPQTEVHVCDDEARSMTMIEDLMREHGILNRILLLYETCNQRLAAQTTDSLAIIHECAVIVHTFIENYHEKLEEEYIFPRLQEAHLFNDLIAELLVQHEVGRVITQKIITLTEMPLLGQQRLGRLRRLIDSFISMYRAHECREDTQIFPAFKCLLTPQEFHEMSEKFEQLEDSILGEHADERILERVIQLEHKLDIELSHYTPIIV